MNSNLLKVTSQSGINQIRGINKAGSVGSGIPKHVTNVTTSVAAASSGLTSTVNLTFRRDPSDANFNGVTVWAKGYQGNQSPTQVASGQDSPISFILSNTGEALSLIVQANGNGGSAPITNAPTAGLTLPKSSGGGAGTTSSTVLPAVNVALTVPGEFAVSGSPLSTATGGTFAISKASQSANTVWAGPASGASAAPTFRNLVQADLNVQEWNRYGCRYSGNGTTVTSLIADKTTITSSGTFTNARVGPTANDAPLLNSGMSTTASTSVGGIALDSDSINCGITRGLLRRFSARVQHNQTTNCRYWVGLVSSGNGPVGNATGLGHDSPNFSVAAFRYSAGTDSTYKAILGTSSVNLTATDTGVSPTTSQTRLFEITFDGTNWNFWIDGVLKVTTNTNSPGATTLLNGLVTADNQTSANACTLGFSWMALSYL